MSNETSLRNRLTQLNEMSTGLADRLEADALRMEQSGLPPGQTLLDELADFRLQQEDLAQSVDVDTASTTLNINTLSNALDDKEGYTDAYRAIDQLLALKATTTDTGLDEVQMEAEIFREDIASHNFEQEPFDHLVADTHSWCSLNRLVTEGDTLQDDEWDELSAQVREHLGSTLATAALRGKIYSGNAPKKTTSVASTPTANLGGVAGPVVTLPGTNQPVEPPSEEEPTTEENLTDNIFEEAIATDDVMQPNDRSEAGELEATPPGIEHSVTNSALFEDDDTAAEESEDLELTEHQNFFDADGPLGDAAREAIRGDRFVRGEKISRVIQHLILAGRSGLACHLSNTMEAAAYPFTRSFPTWMVRAWTLGHAVMFQRGQLASMLSSEFSKAEPSEAEGQLKIAEELFARAVTLRPSIVTPSTGANNILKSFPMEPETTHVFNYCSRISKLGDQTQGLLPGLFRTENSTSDRVDRLSELQHDVEAWKHELQDRSFRYETAKPLFLHANWTLRAGTAQRYPAEMNELRQWQETVVRANRITGPILTDDREQAAEVRTELERLSTTLRESEDDKQLSKAINSEEMRTYLRRAMSFGQRWLAMHQNVSEGEGFVSQAALELKGEVEERHAAVAQEVQDLMNRHNSFEIDVAGACFLLAMDQVKALFSPDAQVPDQEPDPRHLIHAELLKMPELKLTSQWEPTCEASMLEDSILEFLSRPQPDWLTAFQQQIQHGNIDSAERIVGLGTCSSKERSQLQAMLNRHVKSERDKLWADLEETESHINEAVRLEILSEQDRTGFAARVEKVRQGLNSGHEFSAESEELEGLREQLDKRGVKERLTELINEPTPPTPGGWVMDFSDNN